jgi:hypothetical protein
MMLELKQCICCKVQTDQPSMNLVAYLLHWQKQAMKEARNDSSDHSKQTHFIAEGRQYITKNGRPAGDSRCYHSGTCTHLQSAKSTSDS